MEAAEIDEMRRLEDGHWWFVGKRLVVGSLLEDVLGAGERRVLDVGCGTGALLAHLGARLRAVGVDRSPRALGHCRERGIGQVVCAEAGRLPFARGSFDVVVLLDVLEHFADEREVLGGVRDVLGPDGVVLVSVPAFQFLWGRHDQVLQHRRRYTAPELRRVLEASGFVVGRLTYTNLVAFPPAVVVRGLLERLGLRSGEGTDFRVHSRWVNGTLVAAYRLEAMLLRRRGRLPVGLSVAALAAVAPPASEPRPEAASRGG